MVFKQFTKITTNDRTLNEIQVNVESALNPISKSALVDGILLKNVLISSGVDNVISHTLGRKYNGWMVVKGNRLSVNESSTTNDLETIYLILTASTTSLVSIWVF